MPKKHSAPGRATSQPGKTAEFDLPLRITLLRPPPGVYFCLQSGQGDLVEQKVSSGDDLSFDLTVRARQSGADVPPRFLGPFTQGPPDQRFVYIRCGIMAGQPASPWSRRAKVPLTTITWPLIQAVLKTPGRRLEARYTGTAKDGGPTCATVKLLDQGWQPAS
jgi:hypothetical protein